MPDLGWLPPLLVCDWNRQAETLDLAYAVFQRDFGDRTTLPTFQNRRLELKFHPKIDGWPATFWHFVTSGESGESEAERSPEGKRLERIGWPRALIVEAGRVPCRIKVWSNRRKSERRWLLALEDFSYLLVLADRGKFLLPWTAYPVDQAHSRKKLEKEYLTYLRDLGHQPASEQRK